MSKIITNKVIVNYVYGTNNTPGIPSECEASCRINRIKIVKSTCDESIEENEDVYYVITTSIFDEDTPNLVIKDVLPTGMVYNTGSAKIRFDSSDTEQSANVSINGQELTFNVGDVKEGNMITIRFSAKPTDGITPVQTNLVNNATITVGTSTIKSNDVINKYGFSKLRVEKTAPDSIFCDQKMMYDIFIYNSGNIAAAGINLSDDLNKSSGEPYFNIVIESGKTLKDYIKINDVSLTDPSLGSITATYENGILTINNLTVPPKVDTTEGKVKISVYGKVICP